MKGIVCVTVKFCAIYLSLSQQKGMHVIGRNFALDMQHPALQQTQIRIFFTFVLYVVPTVTEIPSSTHIFSRTRTGYQPPAYD